MAGGMKRCFMLMAMAVVWMGIGGRWAEAQLHHVVGGDRGWDLSSDVGSWSSGRIFMVGDNIWFSYSAAESVAELGSKKEFEACDLSNPIRMYTDGLNSLPLDGQGTRYFTSGKPHNCKNGLKLHVEVLPRTNPANTTTASQGIAAGVVAAGPTIPSAATSLPVHGFSLLLCVGLASLLYMAY